MIYHCKHNVSSTPAYKEWWILNPIHADIPGNASIQAGETTNEPARERERRESMRERESERDSLSRPMYLQNVVRNLFVTIMGVNVKGEDIQHHHGHVISHLHTVIAIVCLWTSRISTRMLQRETEKAASKQTGNVTGNQTQRNKT